MNEKKAKWSQATAGWLHKVACISTETQSFIPFVLQSEFPLKGTTEELLGAAVSRGPQSLVLVQ